MTKYMHTLEGEPATFDEASGRVLRVTFAPMTRIKLAGSYKELVRQRRMSQRRFRRDNGGTEPLRHRHVLVEV